MSSKKVLSHAHWDTKEKKKIFLFYFASPIYPSFFPNFPCIFVSSIFFSFFAFFFLYCAQRKPQRDLFADAHAKSQRSAYTHTYTWMQFSRGLFNIDIYMWREICRLRWYERVWGLAAAHARKKRKKKKS